MYILGICLGLSLGPCSLEQTFNIIKFHECAVLLLFFEVYLLPNYSLVFIRLSHDVILQFKYVRMCDVTYCEDGIRYGSEYRTPHKIFRINGYTNPNYDPNVFRLGSIVRSLHDKPRSSEVAKQINNGLQLNLIGSEVIVTNLSTNDIYVAAMDAKMVNAIPIAHVLVRKLETGEQISVFDYVNFTKVLGHNVNYGTEAVQKISDYCYIKVSFKNDFSYDRGLSGLQAPFWVQIKLHSPREWVDRVLKAMPPIKPST